MPANRDRRKKAWSLAGILLGSILVIATVFLHNKLTWQPDHEDLTPIVKDIIQLGLDIEGDWVRSVPMAGSALAIQKKKPRTYSILFSTGGCLDDWSSKRKGTYSNGILRLNRPVTEYVCDKYDTLYTVKVDGHDYLIAQSSIRFLVECYSKDGVVEWPEYILTGAFHRKEQESNIRLQNPLRQIDDLP